MLETIQSHTGLITLLVMFSVITFIGTLIVVPWLVIRIPEDYFSHNKRERTLFAEHHPIIRISLLTLKNTLGYTVVLFGIALLILPGQGILTILAGLVLIDFPGKYKFERWLVSRRRVLNSINWLRVRAGRKPLRISSSVMV